MNRCIVWSVILAVTAGGGPSGRADEAESAREIQRLLSAANLEQAETAFAAAVKEYPESAALQRLHYQFYVGYMRKRNLGSAAQHLDHFLTHQLQDPSSNAAAIPRYVSILNSVHRRAGNTKQAAAVVERALKALRNQPEDDGIVKAISELKGQKILALAIGGETDQAQKLLDQELQASRKQMEKQPDDVSAALRMLQLLQTQVSVRTAAGSDQVATATAALLEFATQQAHKHSDSPDVLMGYINAHGQALGRIARSKPRQAKEQLKQVQEFLKGIVSEDAKLTRALGSGQRMIASMSRRIDAAIKHLELIGKPAPQLDAVAWVNGPSLTDKDLEGKVVLIDFWAVWCGPCIATFPHLRAWQEKYADKELVIIGVTRYYNYEWNEQSGRARRSQGTVSPGDEQAMLGKFAELHKLKHRFMVTPPNSSFQRQFGVTGIPQAVVLDQDGTIQLIRVGSGEQNSHDIEQKIEQLLGKTSPTGD